MLLNRCAASDAQVCRRILLGVPPNGIILETVCRKCHFFIILILLLHFGVPPSFFKKLVCHKVKKVENHWSKAITQTSNLRLSPDLPCDWRTCCLFVVNFWHQKLLYKIFTKNYLKFKIFSIYLSIKFPFHLFSQFLHLRVCNGSYPIPLYCLNFSKLKT